MAFDANDLRDSEHFVIQRTREGAVADFSTLTGGDGSQRTVRAGFLRMLLMGVNEGWPVQLTGVRIKGARIEGQLDLSDCAGAGGAGLPALALEGCEIESLIHIANARFARLSLSHSRLAQVNGRGVVIDGPLSFAGVKPFAEGDAAEAWLCFRNAAIAGDCSGRGARLVMGASAPEGVRAFTPLDLEGARISGNLYLDKGGKDVQFYAKGSVRLSQSRIGGSVYLMGELGAHHGDKRRHALSAQKIEVGGDFSARASFKLREGRVNLRGAQIGKNLNLLEAEIAGGDGIDAGNARIRGSLLLQGAIVKGPVNLTGARVDGDAGFGGGRFIHPGQWAIRAAKLHTGGDVSFKLDGPTPHGRKTVIEGGLSLEGAEIGGGLGWENLALRGPSPDGAQGALFTFADASVRGAIDARAIEAQPDARIDASGARAGALNDDVEAGWGANGSALDLEGFDYARLESDAPWRKRLAWLKRTQAKAFSPQPYTHLAHVYARAGRREDGRRILLAQHDLRTRQGAPGPIAWVFSSLYGLIAGYGLAPVRVLRALVLFVALGVAGVLSMNAQGALVTPEGRACNGAVEPALYALDVALPFIDLGQESRCAPGRAARADLPTGMALGESDWRLFEGVALWRWAHALYALLGAILAALAVLTFSGALKPKES